MAGGDDAGRARKFVPIALVVIGVAEILVGILGTVNDWGATETSTPVAAKDVPTTVDLGPARTEASSDATTAPTTVLSGVMRFIGV